MGYQVQCRNIIFSLKMSFHHYHLKYQTTNIFTKQHYFNPEVSNGIHAEFF